MFGGASIPVSAALFDMADCPSEVISHLFGEERIFVEISSLCAAQTPATEAGAERYREFGWREVIVLQTGEALQSWDHERYPKRKGGKVFVAVGTPRRCTGRQA